MRLRALGVCLGIAVLAGSGCDEPAPALGAYPEHVLARTGYGPDAWSRARIESLGVSAYIDEQLHPERIDDSQLENRLRQRYPALSMSLAQLRTNYREPNGQPSEVRDQLVRAKILRAVYSKRQLEQVLVDFWFDHFNVDARRDVALWAIVPYERDAIRPHVFGRFEDLLLAVASHPAMLEYLDNAYNFRDGFTIGRTVYGVNENFARELLELHTVGPDSGRRLADIHATALAFTGWTVYEHRAFTFLSSGHDRSQKKILGLTLASGGGIEDGQALIRYLARHPDTAIQISRKLCRRFVAEEDTGCEVAAAARWLATNGDLRSVVREVLRSEAFRDPRWFRAKAKRPVHWIASLARTVGVQDEETFVTDAMAELQKLGEDPYAAGPPNGFPDVSQAWLGEGPFLRRLNVANRVVRGGSGFRPPASLGTADPRLIVDGVVARLLPGGASAALRSEMLRYLALVKEYRRLGDATVLVLSSPDFAYH